MDFNSELSRRKTIIDQALLTALPAEDLYPASISQAMRYAVLNGGKRLRPILVLEAARIVGASDDTVMPAALALEMIHCYSLVHDDLPAMDDDDFRRGKPTCHRVYGEAIAILAGDALLTKAFEVLSDINLFPGVTPERLIKAAGEIARAAGHTGMIAGQVVDLESEGKTIDEATLRYMHQSKTGALFRASLLAGALLGGANDEQLAALAEFSGHFGLAFQIADDILDVVGDEAVIGKAVGSDERKEKSTFVSLFGLEESRRMARESVGTALNSLSGFGETAEFLRSLTRYIIERDS
ncbi:MAG: polyprenyl synthetase family protein [Chitinophagales bacterium]